jgi:methylmalonyl-CoA mutase cobalamin-binding subunit
LELLAAWRAGHLPSWSEAYQSGQELLAWKKAEHVDGLWAVPPCLVTATLDDGIGQGLKMIHLFSELAGVAVKPLGLMQSPERVISACRELKPDLLGMTLLQLDSKEDLYDIIHQIPATIEVIVGGPIFKTMPGAQLHRERYCVLNDVAAYLGYLLDFKRKPQINI